MQESKNDKENENNEFIENLPFKDFFKFVHHTGDIDVKLFFQAFRIILNLIFYYLIFYLIFYFLNQFIWIGSFS